MMDLKIINANSPPEDTKMAATAAAEPAAKGDNKEDEVPLPPLLMDRRDIWVGNILPFLGIGHYIFVAGICKNLKEFYHSYYSSISEDMLPKVKYANYPEARQMQLTDTFYRVTFSSVSCVRYWDENTKPETDYYRTNNLVCSGIAKHATNVKVLEWARQIGGFPWDAHTCSSAAAAGRLNNLRYAHENGCRWDGRTCSEAARGGHLLILQYAHDHGCPWNEHTCYTAARNGRLEILRYAHDKGCPWNGGTCLAAVKSGHLEILRYAHDHGCPWSTRHTCCTTAAKLGHLSILQYLHDNGCPWSEHTCSEAAQIGRLDILQYAHNNGCPWNERTSRNAAYSGRLDILKYAHENGCPWDERTFKAARYYLNRFGKDEVYIYVRENGCPQPDPDDNWDGDY